MPSATGDWVGLRTKLEDNGLTVASNFTTDIGGNPVGGLKQATVYSGFLDISTAFDFEKIASLEGLALTVTNYLASGKNLSAAVGNFFGVQEIYVPGNYFFGELDLSQSFLDDTTIVEVGRLFAGDLFATSDLWLYYVSGGINDNLNSMPDNFFFPAFNITAWAVRTTYEPNDEWHLIAGIYNADTRVEKLNNHGVDFSFAMDNGYLAMGQLTYEHHQSKEDNGLPGSTTFGCYYQSSKFQDFDNATKPWHGNYGFYLMFDQMLYKEDWPEFMGPHYMRSGAKSAERIKNPHNYQTAIPADRPKGLTAWVAAYLAPEEHINTQTYQLAGGLLYHGLPPNRDRDVTAFCFILGNFSEELDGQSIETVLELNHRFQVGQWFYITPDIQYVITPNGQSDIDNALVLGIEISANF
ncbi:MAG: carbohydrate porin [Candidatus Omnitrophica bacterium]|nr:carbohydrate porin [Candidatus Omnitrophota bacterium]